MGFEPSAFSLNSNMGIGKKWGFKMFNKITHK